MTLQRSSPPRPSRRSNAPVLTAVLLAALILIGISWLVWKASSAGFAATRSSDGALALPPLVIPDAGENGADAVLSLWKQAAARANIPTDRLVATSNLLADVLMYTKVHPSPAQLQKLAAALPRLLASSENRLRGGDAAGATYWCAYVIVESLRRPVPTSAQTDALRKEHAALVDEIIRHIRAGYKANRSKAEFNRLRPKLDQKLPSLKRFVEAAMTQLQEDFLFPAFKEPLSDRQRKEILAKFDNPNLYNHPPYSGGINMTPEKIAEERLASDIRYLTWDAVVSPASEQILHKFTFNPYWGYMTGGVSGRGNLPDLLFNQWPLEGHAHPEDSYNTLKNWKRK